MADYIQITFTELQPEQKELLIAHLAEAGFEGFEETGMELRAFIPAKDYDPLLVEEIAFKYQLPFTRQVIPGQNWNKTWEASFSPVIVDDFVVVRAAFHPPIPGAEHEIIITPKMSFGTGHHATTTMMVRLMRKMDFRGKHVLDFGTGTGILAILAEKMGALKVTAIDHDDWSILNARENIEQNGCLKIILRKDDSVKGKENFDIILANINRNVIEENIPAMAAHLTAGGRLLISGILEDDLKEILVRAEKYFLRLDDKMADNNWICLKFSS